MYEPLADGSTSNPSIEFNDTNEERHKILDKFLSENLKPEKLKEKQVLCEKLKYRRHQLEVATKELKDELKERKKQSKKRNALTSKMKKSLNLYKLDTTQLKSYEKFLSMNKLWTQYITKTFLTENIDNLNEMSVLNLLKHADYHGAIIQVIKSKCKTLIGLKGIVLQDKRNVFIILTEKNQLKTIPKVDNLFQIEVHQVKFTLIGSNMCVKPELRTTKFIKPKTDTNII